MYPHPPLCYSGTPAVRDANQIMRLGSRAKAGLVAAELWFCKVSGVRYDKLCGVVFVGEFVRPNVVGLEKEAADFSIPNEARIST